MPVKLERKLAYCAGIIDGEGCISIAIRHPRNGRNAQHILNIQVNMQRDEAINILVELLGGLSNYRIKDKKSGKFVREWRVTNKKAYECLKELYPYLRVKKEEARTGINFYEECIGRSGKKITEEQLGIRDAFRMRLQDLKKFMEIDYA